MKKKFLIAVAILLGVFAFTFVSCNDDDEEKPSSGNQSTPCNHCGVDNPLANIQWLADIVSTMDTSAGHGNIYTCTYDTVKDGFLIEPCVGCPDMGMTLMDCEGNTLGVLYGLFPLQDHEVDTNSIQIIYSNYKNVK